MKDNFAIYYFKKLDFIGEEFDLEKDNSSRYRTVEGACFSLLTLIAALVMAVLFGRDVYERKRKDQSSQVAGSSKTIPRYTWKTSLLC